MSQARLKLLVSALVLANVGVWALTTGPLAAGEPAPSDLDATVRQCWYTPLSMGCSEWFQRGCWDVSDC